jgi:uncharacterized membrane protein
MADLIAIGYPDTTTASLAMDEVGLLPQEVVIRPDRTAVVIRDEIGTFKTVTNACAVGDGASYAMFWEPLFGLLFFRPFLGMAFGEGLRGLMGAIEEFGIDKGFQARVGQMLKPGTSALFMLIQEPARNEAVAALDKYGGTVLKSPLSEDAQVKGMAPRQGAGLGVNAPVDR